MNGRTPLIRKSYLKTMQITLPCIDEKEVEVLLSDENLTIKGEKEEKEKDYYRMERTCGSLNRVISLPSGVDTTKDEANFKNGIHSIKLSKTEEAKAKAKKNPHQDRIITPKTSSE